MKSFALLSIDHPDSFAGYHLPVIAVMLPKGITTNKEMVEAIKYEYSAQWALYDDVEDMEQYMNEYCDKLMQNPDDTFAENEGIEITDDCIMERCDYDEEYTPYAFFGIIEPTYSNGIMFLS